MNGFPTRSEQHIIDSQGIALFKTIINQSEYIIRDLGERDYGIDGLLEVVENKQVTGKMISFQLKSSNSFTIQNTGIENAHVYREYFNPTFPHLMGYISMSIKKTTCNYWLSSNMPVILILADLGMDCLYYTYIANQIRQRYNDFNQPNTEHFTFYFPINNRITKMRNFENPTHEDIPNAYRHMLFKKYEVLATNYPSFLNSLQDFVNNRISYYKHIEHQNADPFLTQPIQFLNKTKKIYDVLYVLSQYLEFEFDEINFNEVRKQFQDQYAYYSVSFDEVLEVHITELHYRIMLNLYRVINPIKELITFAEGDFWRSMYPNIYYEALQMSLKEFEDNCSWTYLIDNRPFL